jgi:cytochrome P450
MLGTITEARGTCGDFFRLRLGPRSIYVACHPDHAQEILVEKKDTFGKLSGANEANSIAIMLGNGLLASRGEYWQRQRRMMQPLFNHKKIASFVPLIVDAGKRVIHRLNATIANNEIVDVAAEMTRVTLEIITQSMFGADVVQKTTVIKDSLDVTTRYVFERVRNPFLLPQHWPTPRNLKFRKALDILDEIVYGMIKTRLESFATQDDLLNMLLTATDPETDERMTARQLRDEVATIFSAGHETTAAALSWTWYLLAQHPEILRELQDEVDSIVGDDNVLLLEDVEKLKLARSVFDESMRLYPPGPLIVRAAYREGTVANYVLPKDATVLVSVYHSHRHPEFWIEPDRFDPKRFLDDGHQRIRPAFMPFGIGQRKCIGIHFAYLEATILIAQVARAFDFSLADAEPVTPVSAVTLRPANGVRLRARSRLQQPLLATQPH